MTLGQRDEQKFQLPWPALACFALITLIVWPVRELAIEDDWAYAWTVRHLMETGEYRLHDWLSANMPFQAYWGLMFSKIFGPSFTALRLSTMSLVVLGLIAFYHLAREHGLGKTEANLLTLALACSPLALRLGFTFMTDVPFLMTVIIAVLFYTLAIRKESAGWMILASLVAAASILIRQFGVALICGLVASWLMDGRFRRRPLLLACGTTLPILAGIWQIREGLMDPNWAAQGARLAETLYLTNARSLFFQVTWRPAIILQYMALFAIPLAVLPMLAGLERQIRFGVHHFRKLVLAALTPLALVTLARLVFGPIPGLGFNRLTVLAAGVLCLLTGAWVRSLAARARQDRGRSFTGLLLGVLFAYMLFGVLFSEKVVMPYLPWSFWELRLYGLWSAVPVTLLTLAGGLAFGRRFVERYAGEWWKLPAAERFLDLTSLFFFGAHLLFYQFGDEYLLNLLPLTLIAMGRRLAPDLLRYRRMFATLCLLVAVPWANSTREWLARAEAEWILGDSLLARGVSASVVYASGNWVSHHRFDDYLDEIQRRPMTDFDDYFKRWLPAQRERADYEVMELSMGAAVQPGALVQQAVFRDFSLEERVLSMVKKR